MMSGHRRSWPSAAGTSIGTRAVDSLAWIRQQPRGLTTTARWVCRASHRSCSIGTATCGWGERRFSHSNIMYLDGVPGTAQHLRPDPSAVETTDGRLWFQMTGGLVLVDPARIVRYPVTAPRSTCRCRQRSGAGPCLTILLCNS